MRQRFVGTVGWPRRIWGGTFHAVAHRVIGEHKDTLGLPELSVIDPGDVTDLMDLLAGRVRPGRR